MNHKMYFKIVEYDYPFYFFLFHGINNTRIIPLNKWILADRKLVSDGTNGTKYISGFHILRTLEDAEKYLSKFKNQHNKEIINVFAKGVRKKKHSRSNVLLADQILISLSGDLYRKPEARDDNR
jgi:hypothetical protein